MKGETTRPAKALMCTSEAPAARLAVGSSSGVHWMTAPYAMLMKKRANVATATVATPGIINLPFSKKIIFTKITVKKKRFKSLMIVNCVAQLYFQEVTRTSVEVLK